MKSKARTPRRALATLLLAGFALPGLVQPAQAETLREALAAAYRDNPTLTAARAGLRATDESVNISKASGRPTLTLSSQYSQNAYTDGASAFTADRNLNSSLRATLPVYQGGTVRNNIEAAKTRVEAGEFDLRATELSVFSQVVGAYMDVIRANAITSLSRKNVEVLEVNLKATQDRFEVGDLTRTDVAQSESRLALARSDLKTAEATLINARERYIQLVGHEPVDLQPPLPLPGLPETAETAVAVALTNNPDLASAEKATEAAAYAVKSAQGGRLPTLSVYSQGQHLTYLGSAPSNQVSANKSVVVGAQLSIPLYQGGVTGSRVRQSRAQEQQALERRTAIERDVIAQTRSLYASWQASNQVIESTQTAVSSSALSLRGVRAENSVGTRTILDILNAEQESFSAQVQLVTAQRNAYVAGFSLLAAMGQVSAVDLGIAEDEIYDNEDYYRHARNNLWDWDDGDKPAPIASSTVDSTPQNATVTDSGTMIIQP